MNPSISIIVPVYNAEMSLKRCLDSLVMQSFSNFEVLLVNDGSQDFSASICDSYAQIDSRIKVHHKENGGVSTSRQFGLDLAKGEYIIHVDADDWVAPSYLDSLYQEALKSNADMVVCDYIEIYPSKERYQKQQPTSTRANDFALDLSIRLHGSCGNKLLKSSIIKQNNITFYPGINLMEDKLFIFKYVFHSETVAYVPKALYYYDRGSHSPRPPMIEGMKAACLNLNEYLNGLDFKEVKLNKATYLYYLTISSAIIVYGDWHDPFLSPLLGVGNIKHIRELEQLSVFHKVALFSRMLGCKPLLNFLLILRNKIRGLKN